LAQQQQQQPTAPVVPGPGAVPTAPGLDALRGNPQLSAVRELVSRNPALIQPVIQQIAQSNPQLAQLLASNPESLLDILNEGLETGVGDDGEALPPGAQIVNVTVEERAAIERVSSPITILLPFPDFPHSWRLLAFPDRQLLRRILYVERMKS
jgi:UV excision repair protein RAD23